MAGGLIRLTGSVMVPAGMPAGCCAMPLSPAGLHLHGCTAGYGFRARARRA